MTSPASRPGVRAILTPSWLGVIAVAIAFAGACWFILAPWQYSRYLDRDGVNSQVAAAAVTAPVEATTLLPIGAEPAADSAWRPVSATGTFVADQQVFVRLRQYLKQDAREVLVPLRLTDGSTVLIDRGYVLSSDLDEGRLPAALPTGEVTVTGRVTLAQPDPGRRPDQQLNGRSEVYGIDPLVLLAGEPQPRGGFLQLTADSPAVLIPIGVPDREDGPYLSYALQWYTFGAIALLAVGFFAWREITVPYPDAEASGASDSAAAGTGPAGPEAASSGQRAARRGFDKSQLYD